MSILTDVLAAPPRQRLAALAAVVIVWRYLASKRAKSIAPRLIESTDAAARRVRGPNNEYDFDEYDVVIVGGGTAGAVLAGRLSEDPSIRVLLLEAGGSSLDLLVSQIPGAFSRIVCSRDDWGHVTVPQPNSGNKTKLWPRAKLLGGCSAMNALIFHIGAPEDYDEWAKLQDGQEGASQWSYKDFYPYFLKFEKFHPNSKYPLVDQSLRGSAGPMHTGLFGYCHPGTVEFMQAAEKVGLPAVGDFNTPKGTLGVAKVLTYIDSSGRRMTTERAYLTPDVLARPNLKVITQAHVTRVLFDTSGPEPRAVGAEFTKPNGDKFQVNARKEVVVSAGAVQTPHILMLSGVGPADHLASFGIPVVADLPGVGSHLMDHLSIDLNYLDKTQTSLTFLSSQAPADQVKTIGALLQYRLFGTGPMTSNIAESIAFLRSDDPKLFPPSEFPKLNEPDTTSGPGAPDLEVFCSPIGWLNHGQTRMPVKHHFALHTTLLRPTSTGTVRLRSSDPHDKPIIDPQYLSTEHDVALLVRGVRLLSKIAHTAPLARRLDPAGAAEALLDHNVHALDDAALADVVRAKGETLYHPTSSARMAPRAKGGVVDPFLRVHGVRGLRVVDASVFPTIVSGHTAGPVIAVAEKAADLIKAALRA